MLRVTVNGEPHMASPGMTILQLLLSLGIRVPSLCHDPRLKPIGNCRLCLVEVRGEARPAAACMQPLYDGMEIFTHTEEIEDLRRTQLRLLTRHIPRDDFTGRQPSEFAELVREYGLEQAFEGSPKSGAIDDSHPLIAVDMGRCIQCLRCVRICSELAGRFVWRAWNRGDRTEIRPADKQPFGESECVSCGACADTCPTSAILDRHGPDRHQAISDVRTVCPYCGTGCEMKVARCGGQLVSVRPAIDAAVNRGHLCVKGRYGWDFVSADDRITRPMVRRNDVWEPVTWDQAMEFVARRFKEITARHGPDAIGMLGSSRATNEENYLAQKFARVVIGTNNVDCCARVCHAPSAAGLKAMLGTGAATNSFDDIEAAEAILICGANPTENHPIVGDRIRQAALRGTPLIVIDPRRIELVEQAQVHLQLRPGTNVPLLNGLMQVIVHEGIFDAAAAARCHGWDEFQRFIADYSPEKVSPICGVAASLIRRAARILAGRRPAICFHGLGLTEHVQGTDGVICLVNLALLTGNIGRRGAGVNPLRGQNNVQGAALMGCEPASLTGGVPLAENAARFAEVWQAPVPSLRGLNLLEMINAAKAGRLHALWGIGYDVALTNPQADDTLRALRSLEMLVVQDLFLNETARLAAHVFLPACSAFEKEGTFMNSERRVQRVRKVIETRGESKSDSEILRCVARAMGRERELGVANAEEVWDEIRRVWPAVAGITYQRLEAGGLQWPCPTIDHPGTSVLHEDIAAGSRRVSLRCIPFRPTPEQPTDEYPMLLNTGRSLYQFNAGTMISRASSNVLFLRDEVQISFDDALAFGIEDGKSMRLRSRYGSATLTARVGDLVRRGELFATFHTPEAFVNRLTGPHRDAVVDTPEYKVTAVAIEPLA